jgi:hypothetical protein
MKPPFSSLKFAFPKVRHHHSENEGLGIYSDSLRLREVYTTTFVSGLVQLHPRLQHG